MQHQEPPQGMTVKEVQEAFERAKKFFFEDPNYCFDRGFILSIIRQVFELLPQMIEARIVVSDSDGFHLNSKQDMVVETKLASSLRSLIRTFDKEKERADYFRHETSWG
ncbi:hypothetical protein KKC60_00900 [Patescibacteria group bacterium]|nr:hypothetical protein [Patescibacteria group bacterium]